MAKKKGEESDPDVCSEVEERKSIGQHRALHCFFFFTEEKILLERQLKSYRQRKAFRMPRRTCVRAQVHGERYREGNDY